jgi:hypothetical protein
LSKEVRNNDSAHSWYCWTPISNSRISIAVVGRDGRRYWSGQPSSTALKDLLSGEERSLVTTARGNMKLVDIYLDISDKHLRAADSASDAGDFKAAERELDIYSKAATEASNIAFSGPENKNKLGKRIEQRLYVQIRTLEVIDRRFPADAVGYPDAALDHTRQLRAHALNQTLAVGQVLVESKDGKEGSGKAAQEGKKDKAEADPAARPVANPPTKRPQYFLRRGATASVQLSGDYMTEQENEDVREAQEIDSRIKVFMKIASHRLALLTHAPDGDAAKKPDKKAGKQPDQQEKDEIALSKLSHTELLRHYSRAIQETMDKLDDAHERNPKSGALTKALVTLRDSTDKQLSILHSLEPGAKDHTESDALRQAIKDAEEANKGAHQALAGKG